MYTEPQKTQQQQPAAITSSGTGSSSSSSSTRFRRQKIVPAVVARKIGANSTKSSAKLTSFKESPKEAPSQDESKQVTTPKEELVADVINLPQVEAAQSLEVSSACQAEESRSVSVKDDARQDVASSNASKPPAAFRRIKPKVAIPQTQKPVKSILKKSTPIKDNPTEAAKVEHVPKVEYTLAAQENSSEATVETRSFDPTSEQFLPEDKNQHMDEIVRKDTNIALSPTQQPNLSPSVPTILATSHENEENQPKQVAEQSKSPSPKDGVSGPTNNVPSVSILPALNNATNPSNATNLTVTATKTIKRRIKLDGLAPQIAELLKGSIGNKKSTTGISTLTKGKKLAAASFPPSTSHENEKNLSNKMVVEQSQPLVENNKTSDSAEVDKVSVQEMRIDNVPSASPLPITNVPLVPSAKNVPSNGTNTGVAPTKIIKRAYKLGEIAQIADLLKRSIGKKMTTSKPMQGRVAAVSKPPDHKEELENVSSFPNVLDANQDTKSSEVAVEENKASVAESVSCPAAADKAVVEELRLDNNSPQATIHNSPTETVVTKPPSPTVQTRSTAPAAKMPIIVGQTSGGKQIQKVLKLTPEQWHQALKNAKKGKASSKAKDSSNVSAPPQPNAMPGSTPIVPQNESPIVASAVPVNSSNSMEGRRLVNIISNIVLPPVNVPHSSDNNLLANSDAYCSLTGVPSQPNIFSVSDDAVAINIPMTPPGTTPTYPKLIILHQPAPASGSSPSTGKSSSRLKLPQDSFSVTVLPKHTVRAGHPPSSTPSSQKRPLPTPDVTVRQISPKKMPYASAARVPLPTPIISVTVTPAANDEGSSCALANNHLNVPNDPRIVPKIVIDRCDTAEPDDSQASHSSTSSSSSSCQNSVPKHQPKKLTDICTTTAQAKDCLVSSVMGCSPDIRDKLRAKSLQNLRKKKESENRGQLPRQYAGPAAKHLHQGSKDANVLQHIETFGDGDTTVNPTKTDGSAGTDLALSNVSNIASNATLHSKTPNLDVQCVITEVAGQSEAAVAAVPSSVPKSDKPKKDRGPATASNSKHAETQELSAPNNGSLHYDQQHDEPLVQSGCSDGNAPLAGSTVSPNTQIPQAPVGDSIREEKKDCESNAFFGFSSASIDRTERDFEDRARTIDLMLAKRQSEEGTSEKEETSEPPSPPMKETTDDSCFNTIEITETAVPLVPDQTDNTQQIEEPREVGVNLTEIQPETTEVPPESNQHNSVRVIPSSDEMIENEQQNDMRNISAEKLKDCLEAENFEEELKAPDPVSHDPDFRVPPAVHHDCLYQPATGVDLIVAVAAMRRDKRIFSVDDFSDREYEIGSREQASVKIQPSSTQTPSTSSRCGGIPLGHRKERNRRKRWKDELIKLLWKHVNHETLVADLVSQEKRRFNYQSSSDVESESNEQSESEELTHSSAESMVEETILKRVLANVKKPAVECGQQQTTQNDQRDELEPSTTFVGDKSTEESNEVVPSCESLSGRSVDPVAQSNEPSFAPEPITTVCDKIETNVKTCDTSSSAVAELNNTHTEQVQLAPVSRKRRRLLSEGIRPFAKRKPLVQKRSKLNRRAAIDQSLRWYGSSDGSCDEVVSDCSTDGLSTVEVATNSRQPAASVEAKSLPSEVKEEPGRSRLSRRRYSSSSNSSTAGNSVSLSREGHLSAREESKSGMRRKVRRRKKRTTTDVGTVDSNVRPSTSTTSNLDGQYVITEVAEQAKTSRVLDVINVRNNRIVKPAEEQSPAEVRKDVPKKGRGRGTKSKQAEAPKLTVSKNDTGGNNSTLNNDPEDEPLVKCGNCGGDVVAAAWDDHANYHNGAAYRVGVDATLDMKDVKAISTAILRFMKIHNRKELACERCGMVKKSGLGMASHYISCGLTELELEQSKAACVHCGRKMKAVSLLVHQQQHCRVLKEQQRQLALGERDAIAAAGDKDTNASGRKKRKSVASAERMIKKMSKEINEDPIRELMVEVTADGVSNTILQCWQSHLKQSDAAVCDSNGCPFFGMTSEHMRREHSTEDGSARKPLYQCGKCTYMSTNQEGIKTHLTAEHPQLMREIAAQLRQMPHMTSGNDSDAYAGYSSTTDDYDSFAPEDEDEGKGTKGGKGKKSKSKAKKTPSKAGSKISTELLLDSSIVSTGTEETDVYKEMVLQESIEFKQDKHKYHIMSAKWTQEFRRTHYVTRLLFADLRPDLDTSYLRSIAFLHSYLPQTTHSIRYVQCNSGQYDPGYTSEKFAHRWQQKATFEGEALGCESLFFCGGPVVSLDWLPLPDEAGNDCDQFLAIACKQRYEEYYSCDQLALPRSQKGLVQIWNVGPIQNIGSSKITLRCPQLAFAIACDYGPIWQVAFCPSGCYNDAAQDLDRLGLLAVAGSDGDVHLYALSRSMAGNEHDSSSLRILPLRPALLLSLSFSIDPHHEPASDFTGRSVQRISWSREKGHNVLAAGYSNGVVAVWNLSVKSPLLAGTKNGIRTLLPVHKILHSSSSSITALDLHYSSGSRFLVVCNADRRLKVYDLGCGLYQPLETLSMVVRSRISAIRWMLHFPVLVIAYDDALYIDRCAYSVHQPRDIGLRMFNIFTVGSEMTDLGTNDWHSMNAVATSGGDLVGHRPVPFVHGMNYKKLPQILTTTIPLKLNAIDDSVDVSYYGAFAKEYGIIFSDTDKVPTAMDTTALHLKTWRRAKFNHYPSVRLNQIRWNPNCNSYTYYAIGYQAGFVRVRVLRT
ncbi:uncharacterized protein LOC126567552 [Anopheles maculipalpis]|uniref:uncharacterized protein LOC126567552 n=1 Tax=Anopheles maculipalpis TaxID=1496333 RepID=UPI002158E77E|nr:uncharacterized protein LOC126567552 [Anopheles maculipalpis]